MRTTVPLQVRLAPFVAQVLQAAKNQQPTKLQVTTSNSVELFMDATCTQLGFISNVMQVAMRVPEKNIYEAEADAINLLLHQELLPTEFRIRCDNMALCFALKKGRSNTPEANLTVRIPPTVSLQRVRWH